jgi:hypothetical protein
MKTYILLILLLFLVSCNNGGSSSGGGHHEPEPAAKTAICGNCTNNSDCESNRCVKFTSGMYRCVPRDAQPGYRCPSGMYNLTGDSCV